MFNGCVTYCYFRQEPFEQLWIISRWKIPKGDATIMKKHDPAVKFRPLKVTESFEFEAEVEEALNALNEDLPCMTLVSTDVPKLRLNLIENFSSFKKSVDYKNGHGLLFTEGDEAGSETCDHMEGYGIHFVEAKNSVS